MLDISTPTTPTLILPRGVARDGGAFGFLAAYDLSPRAHFVYFAALRGGATRAEAERAALAADAGGDEEAAAPAYVDVVWRAGGRERALEAVAVWFEERLLRTGRPSGEFFAGAGCVCVEVVGGGGGRATELATEVERLAGEAVARVDVAGVSARAAFTARRRPTVVMARV